MPPRLLHPDEYELVARDPSESREAFDLDDTDFESQSLIKPSYLHHRPRVLHWLIARLPARVRYLLYNGAFRRTNSRAAKPRRQCLRRLSIRRIGFLFYGFLSIILALVIFTGLFRPSYTRPPAHYQVLRRKALATQEQGRANPNNEKVFIAASIYDKGGRLVNGDWGFAVLNLIELLGYENVLLSIYENDSGSDAKAALQEFENKVKCNSKLIFEEHLSLEGITPVTLPDGTKRIKRIEYLAKVRNRALRPLDESNSPHFDKLLYLNDVIFDPIDAVQLLFSTNVDETGSAVYRAACAVDFINPFKFYDTFATRDLEGYSMGLPFYPWFSGAGKADSRQDVLDGKDAVRVQSCWGGMVAFDAKWFQSSEPSAPATSIGAIDYDPGTDRNLNWHWSDPNIAPPIESRSASLPIRFRAETDLFWDASECCLIHADLQSVGDPPEQSANTGIYMNPFIRVGYSSRTLKWLGFTRRFERLYSIPHSLLNHLVGLPWFNSRRTEKGDELHKNKVWVPSDKDVGGGSFQEVERHVGNGGFCGSRQLQVIREKPSEGEKNWEFVPVPPI